MTDDTLLCRRRQRRLSRAAETQNLCNHTVLTEKKTQAVEARACFSNNNNIHARKNIRKKIFPPPFRVINDNGYCLLFTNYTNFEGEIQK